MLCYPLNPQTFRPYHLMHMLFSIMVFKGELYYTENVDRFYKYWVYGLGGLSFVETQGIKIRVAREAANFYRSASKKIRRSAKCAAQ